MTFKINQQFKYNDSGYIWTIINISGNKLTVESKDGNQSLKNIITAGELKALISLGHYSIIN